MKMSRRRPVYVLRVLTATGLVGVIALVALAVAAGLWLIVT